MVWVELALLFLLLAFLIVVSVFVIFVQPTWTLIELLRSDQISKSKKTVWSVAIFFLFNIPTYYYALFVTKSRWLYRTSVASLVVIALTAAYIAGSPEQRAVFIKYWNESYRGIASK